MPFVNIYVSDWIINHLGHPKFDRLVQEVIPAFVGNCLGCHDPGGHVYASEVSVKIHIHGPYDKTEGDFYVVVDASDSPGRRSDLDQRQSELLQMIATELKPNTPRERPKDISVSVWIRLFPVTSFGAETIKL